MVTARILTMARPARDRIARSSDNRSASIHLVRLIALIVWAVCGAAPDAGAQSLQISPILIEMLPGQMTTTLSVTNQGSEMSSLQLRPFKWSQAGNTESLQPTGDLEVSPPIAQVGPNEVQTFRIVLRAPASGRETSYRLLLDQLPAPASPGMVRVTLRLSVPVFGESDAKNAQQVFWRVAQEQGEPVLIGANRGRKHIRLANLVLHQPAGPSLAVQPGQSPYILAGGERSWRIQGGARLRPGATMHLMALSDAGPVDASVQVSGP